MAKQDEVDPTDGSDAAEPLDATDEVTADQPGDGETVVDDTIERGVQEESAPVAELSDLESAEDEDEPGEDDDVEDPVILATGSSLEPSGADQRVVGHVTEPCDSAERTATTRRFPSFWI